MMEEGFVASTQSGGAMASAGKASIDRDVPKQAVALVSDTLLGCIEGGQVHLGRIAEGWVHHVTQVHQLVTEKPGDRLVALEALGAHGDDGAAAVFGTH